MNVEPCVREKIQPSAGEENRADDTGYGGLTRRSVEDKPSTSDSESKDDE